MEEDNFVQENNGKDNDKLAPSYVRPALKKRKTANGSSVGKKSIRFMDTADSAASSTITTVSDDYSPNNEPSQISVGSKRSHQELELCINMLEGQSSGDGGNANMDYGENNTNYFDETEYKRKSFKNKFKRGYFKK